MNIFEDDDYDVVHDGGAAIDRYLQQLLDEHTHCRKCGRKMRIVKTRDGAYKQCPMFKWGWILIGMGHDSRSVTNPLITQEWL
jgi:hypothetical protein